MTNRITGPRPPPAAARPERAAAPEEAHPPKAPTPRGDVFVSAWERPPTQVVIAGADEGGALDHAFDGAFMGAGGVYATEDFILADVRPVLPNNGVEPTETIIEINGIMTPLERHAGDLQALANSGARVIGIHNASRGGAYDVVEAVGDKAGLGDNPAVRTTVKVIVDSLRLGEPLHFVGHSQGALVIARALREARTTLIDDWGLSPDTVERAFGTIEVETYGGAATHYVDGPRYTHYVNEEDWVPSLFGLGADAEGPATSAGKGAILKVFSTSGNSERDGYVHRLLGRSAHDPRDVYFARREKP